MVTVQRTVRSFSGVVCWTQPEEPPLTGGAADGAAAGSAAEGPANTFRPLRFGRCCAATSAPASAGPPRCLLGPLHSAGIVAESVGRGQQPHPASVRAARGWEVAH